jgi:hypothetical protein
MADPTPAVGLPEVEYMELFNMSGRPVSLKNWKLTVGARSTILPDSFLNAHDYVILCSPGNADIMRQYGKVVPLGSFSLTNDGTTLSLYSQVNQLVFSVDYTSNLWPAEKRNGGYALEMIDVLNPCGERNNWLVSKDSRGGTPGMKNSVSGSNPDRIPPRILHMEIISGREVRLIADEKLDSLNAGSGALITVSGREIQTRRLESPGFRNLILTVNSPFLEKERYTVAVKNLADCSGNLLRAVEMTVGIPTKADSGDVVLNEILFNPPAGGVDFVEIYNNSGKFINLRNWSLGNVINGQPDVFRSLAGADFMFAPYNYLAFTTDQELVESLYPTERNRHFLEVSSLPAFSNDAGGVILQDDSGKIFDRFDYTEKMHDPLIQDRKGISLEKSDVFVSSQVPDNWHSAAYNFGNATPGYENSQVKSKLVGEFFKMEPEAFKPGAGSDDNFAALKYKIGLSGQIATVRIYDIRGRFIRNLVSNQLIGTMGEIRWDGKDETGAVVRTGYYLVLTDLFGANGIKQQFKNKVVVVND